LRPGIYTAESNTIGRKADALVGRVAFVHLRCILLRDLYIASRNRRERENIRVATPGCSHTALSLCLWLFNNQTRGLI